LKVLKVFVLLFLDTDFIMAGFEYQGLDSRVVSILLFVSDENLRGILPCSIATLWATLKGPDRV
jgi:hypothetical protein